LRAVSLPFVPVKKRRPARSRRRRVEREERAGPTPETVRHAIAAGPDPVQSMLESNPPLLDNADEQAIDEIRHVRNAITYQLEAKSNRLSHHPHGQTEMSDELAHAHTDRYLPWSRQIGRIILDVVLRMIMDAVPPGIFEKKVVAAIKLYARMMR
jgi:ElaB/YqjD/DUF883 family membrane-anchored ribosome-binding protein